MNLVTHTFHWKGWMFAFLKMAMLSMGVLLGVYFADFWKDWLPVVWGVFAVTMTVAAWVGFVDVFGAVTQSSNPAAN